MFTWSFSLSANLTWCSNVGRIVIQSETHHQNWRILDVEKISWWRSSDRYWGSVEETTSDNHASIPFRYSQWFHVSDGESNHRVDSIVGEIVQWLTIQCVRNHQTFLIEYHLWDFHGNHLIYTSGRFKKALRERCWASNEKDFKSLFKIYFLTQDISFTMK